MSTSPSRASSRSTSATPRSTTRSGCSARRAIEVGLHFEGPRAENARWAERLAARADEIRAALGGDIELEQWTRSWVRLHESFPLDPDPARSVSSQLGDALRERVTERLVQFIEVLEPLLAEERAAAR